MPKVEVQLGEIMFVFESKRQWVNKARNWFAYSGMPTGTYICLDSIGRVCTKGAEFMRAEQESTYPITVYKLLV